MKPGLIINFYKIFDVYKPTNICEIGTHDGKTANQMCNYLLRMGLKVNYTGYDMFELANEDPVFHKKEHNGKGSGSMLKASRTLEHLQKKHKRFKFNLVKGNTLETLKPSKFDFAFIDGGHSYETVKHDYEMLKDTPIIIFDDYQIEGVRQFVNELEDVYELDHGGPKRRQAVRIEKFDPANGHELVAIFKDIKK